MKELMTQPEIDADRSGWLAKRRDLILATDVVGLVAPDDYGSPTKVYWEKRAGIGQPDTMAMARGRHDEAFIADLFAGHNPEVTPGHLTRGLDLVNVGLCVSDHLPWAGATFDRMEDPDGAVVEIKTSNTGDGFGVAPHGEIPARMHIQCLWQAYVAKRKLVKLAVLFNHTNRLDVYWIVIDGEAEDDIAFFIEQASKFRRQYLLPGVPPPTDGALATTHALKMAYRVAEVERAVVPKRLWQAALAARARRVAAEQAEAAAKNRIAAVMGNAELSVTRDGQPVMQRCLKWPRRIDPKLLRSEYPEIAAEVTKQPPEDEPEISFLLKDPKEVR